MKLTKQIIKKIIKEEMTSRQIQKMRNDYEKTGKLPPHLQKLVKLMNKYDTKITNIIVPGLEWMKDVKEEMMKENEELMSYKDMILFLKRLQVGNVVKITYRPKDNPTNPIKITKAKVTHTLNDMKKAGMKHDTVGIIVRKGEGMIQDYKKGVILWQPTPMTQVVKVLKLEK